MTLQREGSIIFETLGAFYNPRMVLCRDIGPWLLEWLTRGKFVCYASPELHGRPEKEFWTVLKYFEEMAGGPPGCLALCTDYPERAAEYFGSPGRA